MSTVTYPLEKLLLLPYPSPHNFSYIYLTLTPYKYFPVPNFTAATINFINPHLPSQSIFGVLV